MKSFCVVAIIAGFITVAAAVEVQIVQIGSKVTLSCNISYLYETTWLKHNPDFTPTVVLCGSLRDGRPAQGFQLNPRFSLILVNRSLALTIADVEERDLGLYYCIANVNTYFKVGKGTTLQVSSPGSSWLLFQHWYCVVVGFGLLVMLLAVCITHWKATSIKKTANRTIPPNPPRNIKPLPRRHHHHQQQRT